jgi:hypothetical protein
MNKSESISFPENLKGKLKAYSLNYTILLFVLFICILSSFILYNYFYNTRQNMRVRQLELVNHCKSGLEFLLATKSIVSLQDFDSILTVGKVKDSIHIQSSNWGGFTLLKSQVDWKNQSIKKAGLAGNLIFSDSSVVLNLIDKSRPLSLCLNTNITGHISIPRAGLKYEMINGENFSGQMVSEKQIRYSIDTLAELFPFYDSLSITSLTDKLMEHTERNLIEYGLPVDSVYNSFWNATKVLYVQDGLLSSHYLSGQIVVFADSLLIISSDCKLNDVLLIAKDILFEEGFSGRIQCFATHKVELQKDVKLLFPSGIFIVQHNHTEHDSLDMIDKNIIIATGAVLEGIVYSNYPESYNKQFDLKLSVKEMAKVKGLVVWPGSIDLNGEINGQVHTYEFNHRTPTGYYRNYIVNGRINRSDELTGHFIPGCFSDNNTGGILSWLY